MPSTYFKSLKTATDTRFWINNPTDDEVTLALDQGAVSCTTNPTYGANQIRRDPAAALAIVDACLRERDESDIWAVADTVQQRLAARILTRFAPLHETSGGTEGWVSIQGSPYNDDNPDVIIDEALRYRALGPNVIAKIPAVAAGFQAIEYLIGEDVPVIFTEVFGLPQLMQCSAVYERAAAKTGKRPACYITHITGIFDEYLSQHVETRGVNIAPNVLRQAGLAVARRQYRIHKERRLPGILLGGGARHLRHFTGLVGGDMHITINWSTAAEIMAQDPPVENTIDIPTDDDVIEELIAKIPDFRRAWFEDGMSVEAFENYGPVELFRNQFVAGWNTLMNAIIDRKRVSQTAQYHA